MMTLPDAKWLEFLKAGLPTFIGLAAFAAATLYLSRIGALPMELPAVAALIIAVTGLLAGCLAGCLAVGLLLDAGYRGLKWMIEPRYKSHLYKKLAAKKKREFISYIPHLSEKERMIYAHLLHHNQRVFSNTPECGYASNLLALGYVQIIAQNGRQEFDYFAVPFGIPDPVWDALQERKAEFPYRLANAPRGKTTELSPWRTPRV